MNIAEFIRAWRLAKGLKLIEAADLLGMSIATLSRVERGGSMDGANLALVLRYMLRPMSQ